MNGFTKVLMPILLGTAISIALPVALPSVAFAMEDPGTEEIADPETLVTEEFSEEAGDPDVPFPEADELLEGYVESLIYDETGDADSLRGYDLWEEVTGAAGFKRDENNVNPGGETNETEDGSPYGDAPEAAEMIEALGISRHDAVDMPENWKRIYESISDQMALIASGEESSTVINICLSDLDLEEVKYTKKDLGLNVIVETRDNGSVGFVAEAKNAAFQSVSDQLRLVSGTNTTAADSAEYKNNRFLILYSLLADKPYEMYWYDKVTGWIIKQNLYYVGNYSTITVDYGKSYLSVKMPVAREYAPSDAADRYVADNALTAQLSGVVDTARAIALEADQKYSVDYDKLLFFKNTIQELAPDYNSEAASGSSDYGNPWQLIWVFDGDASTKVVCEGYSKAFKLLCDLATFNDENFDCYLISGFLGSSASTRAEGHMWNIVRMDDGHNYLVDLTNSRNGAMHLFLKGSIGRMGDWLLFRHGEDDVVRYSYKAGATMVFSPEELTVSDRDYAGGLIVELAGDQEEFSFDGLPHAVEVSVRNTLDGSVVKPVPVSNEEQGQNGDQDDPESGEESGQDGDGNDDPGESTDDGDEEPAGEDVERYYVLTYSDNVDAGTCEVRATYADDPERDVCFKSAFFTIGPGSITELCDISDKCAQVYSDEGISYAMDLTNVNTGERLSENKDFIIEYNGEKALGLKSVTLTGTGNYCSTTDRDVEMMIQSEQIRVELKTPVLFYSGEEVRPEITVTNLETGDRLLEKKDYVLDYSSNLNAGNGKIKVTGQGAYTSFTEIEFKILPLSINDDSIYCDAEIAVAYNKGKALKPLPRIARSGDSLAKNTDYSVRYLRWEPDNASADDDGYVSYDSVRETGDYVIRVTGMKNYDPETSRDVKLKVIDKTAVTNVSSFSVTLDKEVWDYQEKAGVPTPIEPGVVVRHNGVIMKPQTPTGQTHTEYDYVTSYSHNDRVGTGYVVITGNEAYGYCGSVSIPFTIRGTAISKARVTGLNKLSADTTEYTGNPITLSSVMGTSVQISVNGISLREYDPETGKGDYRLEYLNNENVGTATVIFSGMNGYTGTLKKTFKITPKDISKLNANIQLDSNSDDAAIAYPTATYRKSGAKPAITVINPDAVQSQKLRETVDYQLSYAGNKKICTSGDPLAKVTIKGKGNYTGKVTRQFYVEPASLAGNVSVYAPDLAVKADKKGNYKNNNYKSPLLIVDEDGKKLSVGSDVVVQYYKLASGMDAAPSGDEEDGVPDDEQPGEESMIGPLGKKDSVRPGDKICIKVYAKGSEPGYVNAKGTAYKYVGSESYVYDILSETNDISKSGVFKIAPQKYTGAEVNLSANAFEDARYSKNAVTQLKFGTAAEAENDKGVDFIVIGYSNNVKRGTAKATIRGVNGYSGTKTVTFKIVTRQFLWW